MAELEKQVLEACRVLSRVSPLTPEAIASDKEVHHLSDCNPKHTLRAMVVAAKRFSNREQLGKLRAALLAGTTLFGDQFLLQAERAGTLLGDNIFKRGLSKLFNDLAIEVAKADCKAWKILHGRLNTYIAYQRLLEVSERRSVDVSPFLRNRPRRLVKMALATTELSFLREYCHFEIPKVLSDLIDELGTPEEVASIASFLVVSANEYYPLDSWDFAIPGASDLEVGELRKLMIHGKAMVQQFEVAKYISLFRYDLEALSTQKLTFLLRPPSPEFEYSMRLGFIRSQTNAGIARVDVASKGKASVLSLAIAAEQFAEKYRGTIAEIRDENAEWRRLRLNFPSIPKLYNTIKDSVFYEDLISDEQLSKDFLIPLRHMNGAEIKLTDQLDLGTFHGAWRYLQFVGLVDIALLRTYSKSDPTILLNSLVRVVDEKLMVEFIEGFGLSKQQARDFLGVISADVRNHLGYLDLQYRPVLRIAQTLIPKERRLTRPEIIKLPALIVTSNVLRNVQSSNKFRLAFNAKAFVDITAHSLKSRFAQVSTNRAVKDAQGSTDIDIIVLEGSTLYLFECKHSLPPTGPHEMRDIWEEIEVGTHQLETAMRILSDSDRRQSYLAGWFPGTKPQDTVTLKIVACVLCSHRIFSGFHYKGFPIRDFSSLARLCDDGVVGMGGEISEDEVVIRQYRVIRDKTMSARDLADYCSPDSIYFKSFRPFMHPVTRIERLGDVTVARETFVYGVELEAWAGHMESLGCIRAPDRRQRLKPESAVEVADEEERL